MGRLNVESVKIAPANAETDPRVNAVTQEINLVTYTTAFYIHPVGEIGNQGGTKSPPQTNLRPQPTCISPPVSKA